MMKRPVRRARPFVLIAHQAQYRALGHGVVPRRRSTGPALRKATPMDADDRFNERANIVDKTPEPFRSVLLERLSSHDSIELLTYMPSRTSHGVRSPPTLLTLTEHRWLVVSGDERGGADVIECAFDDTLAVELTEILLQGQLKIDFVGEGMTHSCVIAFNTFTGDLYRDAVRRILRRVERPAAISPQDCPVASPLAEMQPIIFRDAVPNPLAEGRCPVAAVQWPAVFGAYGRELAPAAALLTTDRELVLISEKRTGIRMPGKAKYGYIATYFPLARLARFVLQRNERYILLEIDIQAARGGETIQARFPPECEQNVSQVLECAMRQSGGAFSSRRVPGKVL
jgi:hypothetical protein